MDDYLVCLMSYKILMGDLMLKFDLICECFIVITIFSFVFFSVKSSYLILINAFK